jgi:gamma-glutamylcyclotransferase (GGCT)/AIG2-like uncharacterized protein YtfP
MNTDQLLFSYGTLQHDDVQLATFGRRLEATPDALIGYQLTTIEVRDQEFVAKAGSQQRNLEYTADTKDLVEGVALKLTEHELEQADAYEPAEYKRKLVQLQSGASAWVYLTNLE